MMICIYMIISALATAALAKGTIECRFSEQSGGSLCFGAAGQLLLFHLPKTVYADMKLIKDNKYQVLKVKNQAVSLDKEYVKSHSQNQSELFTGGTFNLGSATIKHTGDYMVEEFGFNGTLLSKVTVYLEIQAPVSKPAVSQWCLSPEQKVVNCSSEGDGVEFSLSLDGQLLSHTTNQSLSSGDFTANIQPLALNATEQDKSSVSDVAIVLNGQLTGNLTCQVWNRVSRHETVIHLSDCRDWTSSLSVITVAVVQAGALFLLLVALCCGTINNTSHTTLYDGTETEVVYTHIKVIRHMKKTSPNSQ